MSVPVLGAFAQTIEARTKLPNAQSAIGRRPKRSESGPMISCKIPFMNKKPDSRNCTADGDAPKYAWIAGIEGSKMFIDNAPIEAKITNVIIVGGVVGSKKRALGKEDIVDGYACLMPMSTGV